VERKSNTKKLYYCPCHSADYHWRWKHNGSRIQTPFCAYSQDSSPSTGQIWRAVKSGQGKKCFFIRREEHRKHSSSTLVCNMLANTICSSHRILFSMQEDFSLLLAPAHTIKNVWFCLI